MNAGFPSGAVVTGDAAAQDFPTTTIYYRTAADKTAAQALANLIGATKIALSDRYGDDVVAGQKQLTVVLGMDLAKNAPSADPTPTDASGDGATG